MRFLVTILTEIIATPVFRKFLRQRVPKLGKDNGEKKDAKVQVSLHILASVIRARNFSSLFWFGLWLEFARAQKSSWSSES